MNDVPWWAYSPSPMTLTFYSLLALYGAAKLHSDSLRKWIKNFAESAFVIGLVILPHDSAWQILQWFRWGHLHPTEYGMVIGVLIRNVALFILCLHSSWLLNSRTKNLTFRNLRFLIIPILVLVIKFTFLTPTPIWSDWTYGIRFMTDAPWGIAYLSGIPDKLTLGCLYVSLWTGNGLGNR